MAQHLAKTKRLIIFTRYPEPGKTKTRMIPMLGEQGAADLQRGMTEHIVKVARVAQAAFPLDIEIRYFGGTDELMIEWLGTDMSYRPQSGRDLGLKMSQAFEQAFEEGAQQVVITGSDIPGITPEILTDTFDELETNGVVLGPATDGGYYLIALSKPHPMLLRGITWGTDTVFQETMQIVKQLKLNLQLLPALQDVDLPDDLYVWENAK